MSSPEYKDSLATIKSTGFVRETDLEFLDKTITKIQGNWDKQQRFRTNTEMEFSVLNDLHYPTDASKYWQCIREQSVQYSELVTGSFEYQRTCLDLEESQDKLKDLEEGSIEYRRALIDIQEKEFTKINVSATLNDRIRELKMWDNKMNDLDNGTFDTMDCNSHQLVSYAKRFEQEMTLLQQNPQGASPSEVQNLVGQFQSLSKQLQQLGLVSPSHPDIEANQHLSLDERQELIKENETAKLLAIEESNK